ncbi:MAG TPA: tetraacyldisaccharide 4'-kinase [Candidatus Egerieousia sp.]|nr:tetraacyldisaccharide 4'-kinase [Candidatus Egerieousia sp.]HPT06209.1 tetraacyldisaccharide 4'-kinase [Candidatus Egerieousia sp.]
MLGVKSKTLLFPYWAVLAIRNYLYDSGIIKSVKCDVPVISVGNITVGGTGKTPHTEMLVRLLNGCCMGDAAGNGTCKGDVAGNKTCKSDAADNETDKGSGDGNEICKVGVISRGYKRKTKGYRAVGPSDDFLLCGDEPLQIKRKFPDVDVAVCSNRVKAVQKIVADCGVNLVILDDAFQYRKIIPSHSILLVNYYNSITGDNLLPVGTLRDLPSQITRADIVIVSKSPDFGDYDGEDNPEMAAAAVEQEEKKWRKELGLKPEQKLYFSTVSYLDAKPVFPQDADSRYLYSKFAVLFSGIADDTDIRRQLVGKYRIVDSLKFHDHKSYSNFDIKEITSMARRQPAAVIMTTEKDSVRLLSTTKISADIKKRLFYLPIEVKIIPSDRISDFKEVILK